MPITLAAQVAEHAGRRPDDIAFVDANERTRRLTWRQYDQRSDAVAEQLLASGAQPGERVAIDCADGIDAHIAFIGCERAGLVAVGLGAKTGERERTHLLAKTGTNRSVTGPFDTESDRPACAPLGLDDVYLLNSTSGTTGLPKVVVHHQRRWHEFVARAVLAGALTSDEVFMSLLPAPFGFGLWTSHFAPTILGAACVVADRFDPVAAIDAIVAERVTVLALVPTQFQMLMAQDRFDRADLSSLRVMFTGGEMIPYDRAAAFEDRTGCTILQFYGSNETGALSHTSIGDDRDVRLRTAGRIIEDMHVRLFAEDGSELAGGVGGPGVPACKGPLLSLGYWDDDAANAELLTPDGWMRMGDLVTIDGDGVLTVVGRTSDFIIRGGKNISAAQVEDECGSHPGVRLCAAVAIPDATYGERVCLFVVLRDGATVTLDDLRAQLSARGVGKELWPERLEVVDGDLPRSSGGKVAKSELRSRAKEIAAGG